MTRTTMIYGWQTIDNAPKYGIHILEASTDGSQVLAAEFTDKKLRILFLKECKAETRAQFDTPFTLEEIFDVRVKDCMPNQFTLRAVIVHHNHNPWILDWMPIIGWSFAKLDIGSKQPKTIEEKADD